MAAQIVLDSDHFHPVDQSFGSIGPLCDLAAVRGGVERAALGPAARVGKELAGVDPAKRGAAFLGVVDGVSEAAGSISTARGHGRIQDQEPHTVGQPLARGVACWDPSGGQDTRGCLVFEGAGWLSGAEPEPPD